MSSADDASTQPPTVPVDATSKDDQAQQRARLTDQSTGCSEAPTLPPAAPFALRDLVARWDEARQLGHELSAQELCRDRPELLPHVVSLLAALHQAARLFQTGGAFHRHPIPSPAAPRCVVVPGYDLLNELGRGGMGVVYLARQLKLDRLVALKMVLAGGHASQTAFARFRAEAEAVARLEHPHIVQIHEVGESDGLPFFSLEYCPGGSLSEQLDGTPWPARKAAALVEILARAMQTAHDRGIVHRDLTPANVLFTGSGAPKVSDFGLAKRLDLQGQTQSGAILGTPSYMAPEQARGQIHAIGPTCDIYALGAILYELLTGRPPFKGPTPLDTVQQVLAEEPVPPTRLQAKTPRDLETICLKCLHKTPGKRYAHAGELAADLQRFLDHMPILASPPGVLARGWLWCQRPERIRDAGAFTLFLAAVLFAWGATGMIGVALSGRPAIAFAQLGGVMLGIYLPMLWIGWGCLRRRLVSFWAGVVLASATLVLIAACLAGAEPFLSLVDVGGLYRNPDVRLPAFSLLLILAGVQFVAYVAGIIAFHAHKKSC